MITESLIRYETLKDNSERICAAHYSQESYYLENNSDRTSYWRTAQGQIIADNFKPEDAKAALIAYLNRNFKA